MKPTVASFFAGIGGFDLGFERAGFQVIFQCEKDKFCQKVLKKHWPEVPLANDINDEDLIERIPSADVWTGGFPCQDLSLANQSKRKGLAGGRSGLFYRFIELVETHASRPSWIVLENVPGLLNSNGGADFSVVLRELERLGYFVAWRILDSRYFGTPQSRRRVFIVASHQNDGAARVLFEPGTLGEVAVESRSEGTESRTFAEAGIPGATLYAIQHATIGRRPTWSGPQSKGFRNDGLTYTLDSRGSADVVCAPHDGFGIRSSTGLPGELDGRRLRACGNAVNVEVVFSVAQAVYNESYESCASPYALSSI